MNESEQQIYATLRARGYTVLRNGWPDFFVVDPLDNAFCVEWKVGHDFVRDHQELMHDALASYFGIETVVTGRIADVFKHRATPLDELVGRGAVKLRDRARADAHRAACDLDDIHRELFELEAERDRLRRELADAEDLVGRAQMVEWLAHRRRGGKTYAHTDH